MIARDPAYHAPVRHTTEPTAGPPSPVPPPAPSGQGAPHSGPTGASRWRDVIVPRTATGTVVVLFAAAVGAAFSGAVLYAYYQYRLQQTDQKVQKFASGFDTTLKKAIDDIRAERDDARAAIRKELEPLQKIQASEKTVKDILDKTKDSVWFVATRDDLGQPSVGSAFVATSDSEQSYLITSLAVVRASTQRPGPPLQVRKGDETLDATLWTWDEQQDLALLIVKKGNLPRLKWAPTDPPIELGQRVFVVSGIGGAGAGINQGFVTDVSAAGVQHDAPVSGAFVGGPVLNSSGEVVGVASRAYAPLGFASDLNTYAPPIRAACTRILRCPNDQANAPAGRR